LVNENWQLVLAHPHQQTLGRVHLPGPSLVIKMVDLLKTWLRTFHVGDRHSRYWGDEPDQESADEVLSGSVRSCHHSCGRSQK